MQHDTLVNVLQAASFSWLLWHDISELLDVITLFVMLDDRAKGKALIKELEKLDPNTIKGLAWQSIKAWVNEPDD